MIYLDNAATSWPKPMACIRAMEHFLAEIGANPSSSLHQRARQGDDVIERARREVALILGVSSPQHVVFTLNATEALNCLLFGFLEPGDRVLASHLEHSSVTRPLAALRKSIGVSVQRIGDRKTGAISADDVHRACERTRARLMVMTHASNVTGALQPVEELTKAAHEHGCAVLVDTAQTAGIVPIKAEKWGIDFLAFSGHKHLLGPMGVGGFYVAEPDRLKPVIVGSAGYADANDEMPDHVPDRFEAGTPNAPGIAGLGASCKAIREKGIEGIRKSQQELTRKLIKSLGEIPGVVLYGPADSRKRVGVVAFNIAKIDPETVGECLDHKFEIMVRTGLCSAPWVHEGLGTMPKGVVRASLGYFTKEEDVDLLIEAVGMIAQEAPNHFCGKSKQPRAAHG